MTRTLIALLLASVPLLPGVAAAGEFAVQPTAVTEWKTVYGAVAARDTIAARARIGGTLVTLNVSEGDRVTAGEVIGTVKDEKLAFQRAALDAQIAALEAQLANADAELQRGQTLVDKGVSTAQRLDQLRTQSDVLRSQIAATRAQRAVVEQQTSEGAVLAPGDGRILTVPVTRDAVIMAGETVATVASGGFFLRLSLPERHAAALKEGAVIEISAGTGTREGRLVKLYPAIEGGRVLADVDVPDLDTAFVGARLLVKVPVGAADRLLVPAAAVTTRHGLDFVTVRAGEGDSERAVLVGEHRQQDGVDMIDIVSGLAAGERLVTP